MTERLNILLAMSDAPSIPTLTAAFQAQGWHTLAAGDVTTALVSARKHKLHAAVLDARLGGGGALIALKRLRASVDTASLPVILTGAATADEKQALLAAGATEHLDGAPDSQALCAAIRRHAEPQAPVVVEAAPVEAIRHPLRMAALQASGLLDSAPDEAFDRVIRLVTKLLGTPTALLSLVDKDRQFFKSQVGLPEPWASARQTPLTHSFCQWVVSGREAVSVNDAREHAVLRHNKAIGDMGVIAYTGVPICTAQGQALGSLCAIDAKPRRWSEHDLLAMGDLAKLAESCVAHAQLVAQPPSSAVDFDHYVETAGAGIDGALGLLRRNGPELEAADRGLLYDLIQEYGNHLVQLNRLIQVNQLLR